MARFVTIGCGDRVGYERTEPAVWEPAHDQDARLQAEGALVGVVGDPVQVRNHDHTGLERPEDPLCGRSCQSLDSR